MAPLGGRNGGGGWADSARELVAASVELLRAEVAELTGQMRRESLLALRGIVLIVVACTLGFWGVAGVLAAAVLGLAVWLEPWLAALVVAGVAGVALTDAQPQGADGGRGEVQSEVLAPASAAISTPAARSQELRCSSK